MNHRIGVENFWIDLYPNSRDAKKYERENDSFLFQSNAKSDKRAEQEIILEVKRL